MRLSGRQTEVGGGTEGMAGAKAWMHNYNCSVIFKHFNQNIKNFLTVDYKYLGK